MLSRRRTRPEPPYPVTVTLEDMSYVLDWSAPYNDGGLPVTNYRVTTFNQQTGSQVGQVTTAGARTATISGLSAGSYYSQVEATNSIEYGSPTTVTGLIAQRRLTGTATGFAAQISGLGEIYSSPLTLAPVYFDSTGNRQFFEVTRFVAGTGQPTYYVVPVNGTVDVWASGNFLQSYSNPANGTWYDLPLKFFFYPSSADARLSVTVYA